MADAQKKKGRSDKFLFHFIFFHPHLILFLIVDEDGNEMELADECWTISSYILILYERSSTLIRQ
jgi:hypothetical protein